MKRVEIIANHSIEVDVFDALKSIGIENRYTLIPGVLGEGSNGGRLGTPIWPEENFLLILYLEDEICNKLFKNLTLVKKRFPEEGLKMVSQIVDILL